MQIRNDSDTSRWNLFKFSDIFVFNRGRRLTKNEQEIGDIAFISSTKNNNGIDNYITPPVKMIIYENVLTLNNSGSVGYCFYHQYKIVCSDHCTVISIKDSSVKLNLNIALFLKPIIESMRVKYNFGREISNRRLGQEYIKLPQGKDGDPDWVFMSKYITKLSKKVYFHQPIKKNKFINLSKVKMHTFCLKKLFKVRGSISSFTKDEIRSGDFLYVTTSSKNNGVASTSNIFTENGGVITIDSATNGKAFFQEKSFVGSDHVEVLEPIGFKLNKYSSMFFITILNLQMSKYSYGRKRSQKRIKKEVLYLPFKIESNEKVPDLNVIENYIKSLPYSNSL